MWFIKARKISGQASCETRKIYNTRVAECRADNVARESTRTRCLNSAIYQTLLSSEPFHVAINVSTAGTSYFKALWHRHAHAKFASRRRRRLHITLASSPCASLSHRSGDLSALSRWQHPADTKREPNKDRTWPDRYHPILLRDMFHPLRAITYFDARERKSIFIYTE